jgi:hypothetical protein
MIQGERESLRCASFESAPTLSKGNAPAANLSLFFPLSLSLSLSLALSLCSRWEHRQSVYFQWLSGLSGPGLSTDPNVTAKGVDRFCERYAPTSRIVSISPTDPIRVGLSRRIVIEVACYGGVEAGFPSRWVKTSRVAI